MSLVYKRIKARVKRFFTTAPLKTCWHCAYSQARHAPEGPTIRRTEFYELRRVLFYCAVDDQSVSVVGGCAAWVALGRSYHLRPRVEDVSAHEKAELLFKKASTYERIHRDRV